VRGLLQVAVVLLLLGLLVWGVLALIGVWPL